MTAYEPPLQVTWANNKKGTLLAFNLELVNIGAKKNPNKKESNQSSYTAM